MAGSQMIQEEFEKFVRASIRRDLDPQQYIDLRRTFVAGALAFLHLTMEELSPGNESTEHDERLIQAIQTELREFGAAVKRGEK